MLFWTSTVTVLHLKLLDDKYVYSERARLAGYVDFQLLDDKLLDENT